MSAREIAVPAVTGNARFALPPVRRGAVFCSPWCGSGCTWAAHEKAHERAAALAASLGPNWTPRVWENMGWHFCSQHATLPIEVHQHEARRFMCYANLKPQFLGEGSSARAALQDALGKARAAAEHLQSTLAAIEAQP